tara:strand:- start:758 stop:922 length:165 start_codon:yes stop_codon:yes gene_type:complete
VKEVFKMSTKEQLEDMIEVLSLLNVSDLDEEARDEAVYVVNDIIISLEELIDLW